MPFARLCPVCKRPLAKVKEGEAHPPFCSKRCADIDLSRWLNGSYAIPAIEDDSEPDVSGAGEGEEGGLPGAAIPALKH